MNKLILVLIVAAVTAGCASSVSNLDDVKSEGEKSVATAAKHAAKSNKYPHVRYTDTFWVPPLQLSDADKPTWYFEPAKGAYNGYTLEEVMQDVMADHGVNVRYLDGIEQQQRFSFVHDGNVGGLLEKVSFATKFSFEIQGDLLTWSKFKTQSFPIKFIAGRTDFQFGTKENSQAATQAAASGAGSVQTAVTDTGFSKSDEYISFSTKELSIWKDLKEQLGLLKSKDGNIVVSEATSSVLVKDYPDNVAAIGEYIKKQNDKLTQMIVVDYEVIEYSSNEGDQLGINWSVVKEDLASGGVLGLATQFTSLVGDGKAPTVLGYSQKTGKYAGSKVLIDALQKHGAVTSRQSKSIASLNNQVSRLIQGGDVGYLAQSGGTATANVGSQDNLVPGILKKGTAVYMLPNAVDDTIVIQLSTKASDLKELRIVKSGDRSIESPETVLDETFLKFSVKDGETLLISGSSNSRNEYQQNSTGGLLLLGGELGGTKSTKETIILITPRIIKQ